MSKLTPNFMSKKQLTFLTFLWRDALVSDCILKINEQFCLFNLGDGITYYLVYKCWGFISIEEKESHCAANLLF